MLKRNKKSKRILLIASILLIVIIIVVTAYLKLSFFNGANIVSINCGTVQVGENGSEYNLVTLPHDTYLNKVSSCLQNNLNKCIPSHAELNMSGIDTSTIHNVNIFSKNGSCLIKDTITNAGMGTDSKQELTCNSIDTNSGLIIHCNNYQDVNVSYQN